MSRLIVVSNRVPGNGSAGGLASGLRAALSETGGVWFGWSGTLAERTGPEPRLREMDGFRLATVDLSRDDHEGYYNGFANSTLWPLFHGRLAYSEFRADWYEAYRRVNSAFAGWFAELAAPEDLIWVHDYHLLPLGQDLRQRGVTSALGFFLHIPFPHPEVLSALPWHVELVRVLMAYDLLGFQTRRDRRNFHDFIEREAGGTVSADGTVSAFGRVTRTGVYPIGIDVDHWTAMVDSQEFRDAAETVDTYFHGRSAIVGAERLDYTKGLTERFRAYERLLERHPDYRGTTCFLQVAAPSRERVARYRQMREELERITGHVNGRFGGLDWTPVRYLNRTFSQTQLGAFYHLSRVGMVTPLKDGMNLVAKEYVAAQRAEDPGVLVLSRFAGAAEQLDEAIMVNPYDVEDLYRAMHEALEMPLAERQRRWRALMATIRRSDIGQWRHGYLNDLRAAAGLSEARQARLG